MNLFLFLFATLFLTASASFTNCASHPRALPVSELYIDPPSIVAANQPIFFRIAFTVPQDTYVPHALIETSTNWNGLSVSKIRTNLNDFISMPITPGDYNFTETYNFPVHVWGRISTDIRVYNASGAEILCARWIVFATGTDKNETGWPWSAIYS